MQANFIEKAMTTGFKKLKEDGRIDKVRGLGFVSVQSDEEMKGTVKYIQEIAKLSHIKTFGCDVKDFKTGGERNAFFKMYPYEWLVNEMSNTDLTEYDPLLAQDLKDIDTIEPAWKLILGNKAILPLLWEMFPGHPNLVAAYFIDPKV